MKREGVTIRVAQYQLLVEDACSGMNSLIGLTAISLFYIYLLRGSSIRYAGIYYVTAPGYPVGLYSFSAKGKDSGKEHGKDYGKDQGKETGKEYGKEQGKETGQEMGKDAGMKCPDKMVHEIKDQDHRTLRFYGKDDSGKETMWTEITFTRVHGS